MGKMILVNAQWQGGADPVTYDGAREIIDTYLGGLEFVSLPVSTDEAELAGKVNGIRGFDVLRRQMKTAYEHLQKESPDELFVMGGGCDADVPAVVYLSEKYQGDLTVIWLDAHGDLNAPDESATSLFYGMPLRSLMDDTCFGLLENRFTLGASQIIHIGGRDFDNAEMTFIKESGISAYTVQAIHSDHELIGRAAGHIQTSHVYIHLDLDVLDPLSFPNTPLPVDNGLSGEEVCSILDTFADKLVGLGIYEYAPSGERDPFIEKLLQFGLAL